MTTIGNITASLQVKPDLRPLRQLAEELLAMCDRLEQSDVFASAEQEEEE